ncbi:MAG: hypothetical protein EVA65_02540 [Oceanococcus sp.]|nr:MAG: hypothetical protein EVA65_02540 [Oceanococcus sp.]
MAQPEATKRAEAVTRLWELKRLSDKHTAQGMPFVHFSMLLSDQVYRDGILAKAERANDPALRDMASELKALNLQGRLREAAPTNGAARASAAISADGISLGAGGSGGSGAKPKNSSRGLPLLGLAVLAVALIGGGVWFMTSSSGPKTIAVDDNILQNTVWKSGNTYVLSKLTFVESNARLTIEPGVTVRGKNGSALIVTRDASVHARGRVDQPIVFTSAKALGNRQAGDWGGLVLLGNAPVNRDAHIEGIDHSDSRGDFGGSDSNNSCGVLDFVRIEFAGFEISKDNELNGLTLGGCGDGTIVRNVQVHMGLDDGVEVFGGTVDLKNIVVTGADDDAFDWDMGWTGRVQNLIIQMHPDRGDNGFEGDNYKADMDAQPRSQPQFYNVTMISDPQGQKRHRAMTVRRGSGGHFHNVLIDGFTTELIDLRDEPVTRLVNDSTLSFASLIVAGTTPEQAFPQEAGEKDDDGGFVEAAYLDERRLEFVASTGLSEQARDVHEPRFSPARINYSVKPVPVPQGEFWDESADYFGAVRPGDRRDWSREWTAFPAN